jgi:hypothetical protein
METAEERSFLKRFLTNGIVAWVSLAVSIVALVRTLPHSNQAPAAKVPKPPDGFLLDPRNRVFSWHENNVDQRGEDHTPFGGWEADGDRMNYVAYGRASIRGVWKSGIIALAHPDGNRLHIEWPIKAEAGQKLQFTCCLTDHAIQLTHRGIKVRVELSHGGLSPVVLADDEELKPGDQKVIELTQPLTRAENKLTVEVDDCGSEYWTTFFCNARLE